MQHPEPKRDLVRRDLRNDDDGGVGVEKVGGVDGGDDDGGGGGS